MKWILATLLVALAVIATTAVAASGSSSKRTTLDLALDGQHAVRTLVDAVPKHRTGAPDDSPGDTIVLHAPLLDSKNTRMGTIDATFLTTASGTSAEHDGSEQLTGTLTFLDGSELAVQGIVGAFAHTSHVAIVGGTGRYAGARGQVTAHFTPRAVRLHLELF
jgi:dirigent-like protein